MRGPNPCQDGHLNQVEGVLLRHTAGIWELKDARGIGCGYVCNRCVEWKMAGYRPEVFEGRYEAEDLGEDEPDYSDDFDMSLEYPEERYSDDY